MSMGSKGKTPEISQLTLPNFQDSFKDYLSQRQYIPELGAMMKEMNDTANSIFQDAIGKYAPNATADIQQMGTQASSLLKGQLPQDVSDYITRQATAKSYANGTGPTSGMGKNLTLRDLGISSLDAISKGQTLLSGQLQLAQGMNPYRYDAIGANIFSTKDITDRKDAQAQINWQIQNQNNANAAANKNQSSGIGSLIGGIGGGIAGGFFGGPVGAGLGMSVGSMLGGAIEGGSPTSSSAGFSSIFNTLGGQLKSTSGNDWSNIFSSAPSSYR